MADFLFFWSVPQTIFPKDGMQFMFPLRLWMGWWPMHSNDSGLMFLKNVIFDDFKNTCVLCAHLEN